MMRNFIFMVSLLATLALHAQTARWVIHPNYDSVEMLGNGYYIVSQEGHYGMLNAEEKEVLPLRYDSISNFNSNKALLFEGERCVGYVSDHGELFDLKEHNYDIVGLKQFSCGYLAVNNASGFFYICANDDKKMGPYSWLSPFCEDYAWVKKPKNLRHIFDGESTYEVLSAKTGEYVKLAIGEYNNGDIDFLSSCSNGKSIVVLKKRFYEYDYATNELTPLSTDGNPDNKKSRVMANERPVTITNDGDGYHIIFKQGIMKFDHLMRLISITYDGQPELLRPIPEVPLQANNSPIKAIVYNGTNQLGLSYDNKNVLPAQFDTVSATMNNEAVVCQQGKYGIVAIDKDVNCRFVLNENRSIGFEHSITKVPIKVVCPPFMNPRLMSLISLSDKCTINTDTRDENVNVETAVLSYECTLNIPDSISWKQTLATIKLALNYDGLHFQPTIIPFKTWFAGKYSVQKLSEQKTESALSVELMVKYNEQRDGNYFCNVHIEADDSVKCSFTKTNEELYSAHFSGWKNDTIRFYVDVTEEGCPTMRFEYCVPVKTPNKEEKDKHPVSTSSRKSASRGKQGEMNTPAKNNEHKIILIPKSS